MDQGEGYGTHSHSWQDKEERRKKGHCSKMRSTSLAKLWTRRKRHQTVRRQGSAHHGLFVDQRQMYIRCDTVVP